MTNLTKKEKALRAAQDKARFASYGNLPTTFAQAQANADRDARVLAVAAGGRLV